MRVTIRDRNPAQVWLIDQLQGTESFIAGAGAGVTSATVTCPLDVIKTKLQAQGPARHGLKIYRGLWGSTLRILREEGPRGLYRGLGPNLLGYLPTWAIYFTVYDYLKVRLVKQWGEERWAPHMIAATTAGASGTLITSPLWVIKTRFMTQNVQLGSGEAPPERYRHTLDALRKIYQTEGLRGFYRGLTPSLIGLSHVAVQFPLYEQLKIFYRPKDGSDIRPGTILMCSSGSKMVASVTTYPHEVVRTRLQIQRSSPQQQQLAAAAAGAAGQAGKPRSSYYGLVQTTANVYREEGIAGFYRGLGVNLIRTVPATALTILTYELILRRLNALISSQPPRGSP